MPYVLDTVWALLKEMESLSYWEEGSSQTLADGGNNLMRWKEEDEEE
jgi:hypothetical protein